MRFRDDATAAEPAVPVRHAFGRRGGTAVVVRPAIVVPSGFGVQHVHGRRDEYFQRLWVPTAPFEQFLFFLFFVARRILRPVARAILSGSKFEEMYSF